MKTVNPKKIGHYKRACHELISEIWGDTNKDRAEAYKWFKKEFGRDIHFSAIDDEIFLKEIFDRLWVYSFKSGE